MDTLEQLRRRLTSFEDLGEIVRTMKAFAAVTARQYEQAVESLAVYYRTVQLGLHVVLRAMPSPVPQGPRADIGRHAVVVFGSDHGLCGRFNEEIVAHALEHVDGLAGNDPSAQILSVGARVTSVLEDAGYEPDERILAPGTAASITSTVRRILLEIDRWQIGHGPLRIDLVHNRPLPGNRYEPIRLQLLPVDLPALRNTQSRWPSASLPTYSMKAEQLFAALLRQYLFVTLFRSCAESLAAENASRLAAMQAAERNLRARHEELLGEFRRHRQDAITAELLDIVSGYEALQATAFEHAPGQAQATRADRHPPRRPPCSSVASEA